MSQALIADNIAGFARVLRGAGIPAGPGATIDALAALNHIDLSRRTEAFAALQAVFVKRREHAPVFREAFNLFFSGSDAQSEPGEAMTTASTDRERDVSRRVREAMAANMAAQQQQDMRVREEHVSSSLSDQEVLQKKDFAQMSAAEQAEAIAAMRAMMLSITKVRTRRMVADINGARLDLRRTLRGALRGGGELTQLRYRGRKQALPPIVALLDISGSMSDYTRMFLHFLHAVSDSDARVSSFLFGTRLTNVTRSLRACDPDEAIAACVDHVEDWAGGTRIAPSLHAFNKLWGRRVLGQGAVVLLITDGLERAADEALAFEMDRLHRSCRRLIWLNPLLRFDGFEPKARGIKTMLPHVDEFLPIHNLESLKDLARLLAQPGQPARLAA